MQDHNKYIHRCFEIAKKGRGFTRSNPLVGSIFVHNDKIVSEGYHQSYGEAHAEVNCLEGLDDSKILSEGTLYVSLEPCCHHGKTPPCTQLIISKGIKRVVIGSTDFNEEVKGNGIAQLITAGIEVTNLGLTELQKVINRPFFINQTLNRPFFTAKLAFTNDEFIGREGEQIKITSEQMNFWSHKIRSEVDAIIVGKNTWANDHPRLDARLYSEAKPDILILSHSTDIPIQSRENQKIICLNPTKEESIQNVHWIKSNIDDVHLIAKKLYELGYYRILIEGGAIVLQSFLQADLVDELITIENKGMNLRSGIKKPAIDLSKFTLIDESRFQNEQRKTYFLQ